MNSNIRIRHKSHNCEFSKYYMDWFDNDSVGCPLSIMKIITFLQYFLDVFTYLKLFFSLEFGWVRGANQACYCLGWGQQEICGQVAHQATSAHKIFYGFVEVCFSYTPSDIVDVELPTNISHKLTIGLLQNCCISIAITLNLFDHWGWEM